MSKSTILTAGALSVALLVSIPAQAALVIGTVDLTPLGSNQATATYTDFGVGAVVPNPVAGGVTLGNAAGGNITFTGGGAIVTGSVAGQYAQPANSVGNYLTTGFNGEAF